MPVLTPAELWEQTGRYEIPELFKLKDRDGRDVRPAADARGDVHVPRARAPVYRQLPQILVPLPDEGPRRAAAARRPAPRPRVHHEGRVLVRPRRGRARRELPARTRARTSGSSSAAGSRRTTSQAESRDDGRQRVGRLPRAVRLGREHARHAARTATTRPTSRSRAASRARPSSRDALDAPEEVETPGRRRRSRRSPSSSAIDPAATVEGDAGREGGRHARARARPRRRPARARRSSRRALGAAVRPATDEEIRAAFGAERRLARPGRLRRSRSSPTRRCARASSSPARTATGWHLRGVEAGRDFEAALRRHPRSRARATRCPSCGGALRFQTAIEVGHIFKLGTRYSEPLGATFLDEDGQEKPLVMGSYGIGPGRDHGGGGRAAPRRARDRLAARRSRRTTSTSSRSAGRRGRRRRAASPSALEAAGATSCSTTATCAPGEKFADADLIGCPVRVTVGKKTLEDGAVDVRDRATGEERARRRSSTLARGMR